MLESPRKIGESRRTRERATTCERAASVNPGKSKPVNFGSAKYAIPHIVIIRRKKKTKILKICSGISKKVNLSGFLRVTSKPLLIGLRSGSRKRNNPIKKDH